MEYAWSINEEEYHGTEDTREAAIQAAIDENDIEPGQTVWTGEIVKRPASYFLQSADRLIEDMQERAYDHAGEYSENWLAEVTSDQEKELSLSLRSVLDEWAERHGHHPRFYDIVNTIPHEVTEIDEADSKTEGKSQ